VDDHVADELVDRLDEVGRLLVRRAGGGRFRPDERPNLRLSGGVGRNREQRRQLIRA